MRRGRGIESGRKVWVESRSVGHRAGKGKGTSSASGYIFNGFALFHASPSFTTSTPCLCKLFFSP